MFSFIFFFLLVRK